MLTEFEDRSSPRPGSEDVFFSRSDDRGPLERAPNIEYVERFWSSETAGVGLLCCAPPLVLLLGLLWGTVRLVRFCWWKWGAGGKAK